MGDESPNSVVSDTELLAEPPTPSPTEKLDEVGDVHLIYRIEGQPHDVPIFELAHILEAVGLVLQETNRVVNNSQHGLSLRVRPFEEGSWVMDVVLSVQTNPAILFFLTQPEAIEQIKKVLEYVGLIKKGTVAIQTVLDVAAFLKGKKPEKTERLPDGTVTYFNEGGDQINVPGAVSNLYLNPVIHHNYYNAFGGNGMNRPGVEGLATFIKNEEVKTRRYLPKEEVVKSLRSYSEPLPEPPRVEKVNNETVRFLNPKEGTYGSAEGVTFLPAGKRRGGFKARISDLNFLARFHSGQVRFYQNDLLKVRVKSEETLNNGKSSIKHEIVEVMEYKPSPIQGTNN